GLNGILFNQLPAKDKGRQELMGMTFFSCPTCKASLGSASGFAKKLYTFGPPFIRCHRCGTPIRTGATEWPDLSRWQQRLLWFQHRVVTPFILGPISIPVITMVACFPLSFVKAIIPMLDAVFFTIAGTVGVIGGVWLTVSEFRGFPIAVAESKARWKAAHQSKEDREQCPAPYR
ncbi:unnamed protein product, partial [marine sediment metagenome]